MAQKPDFYEVLGVDRAALKGLDEKGKAEMVKKAFTKLAMKFHPDRHRAKSEAEKKTFMDANLAPDVRQSVDTLENYMQLLDEARGVLEDPSKRTTYDNYGHKGLENLASGKSAGTGQTWEQAAGPVQRKVYSEGDTMDFFDKIAERNRRDNGSSANDDGLTSEQRRERARQERRNRRNRDNNGGGFFSAGTPTPPEEPATAMPAPQADFEEASRQVGKAADRLRQANESGATVPLAALERFRENLQDFMAEVDTAIARAKNAPRNGYNR